MPLFLPRDNELYLRIPAGEQRGGGYGAGTLSSAESAAKNNVHVELRATDSSHFYVCLHTPAYPFSMLLATSPFSSRRKWQPNFSVGGRRRQHSSFQISRSPPPDPHQQNRETIFSFRDGVGLRCMNAVLELQRTLWWDLWRKYDVSDGKYE